MKRLIQDVSLQIVSQESIQKEVGSTEIANTYADIPREVASKLRTREFSNVYQMLFVLTSNEGMDLNLDLTNSRLSIKPYHALVFFDEEKEKYVHYPINPEKNTSVEINLCGFSKKSRGIFYAGNSALRFLRRRLGKIYLTPRINSSTVTPK